VIKDILEDPIYEIRLNPDVPEDMRFADYRCNICEHDQIKHNNHQGFCSECPVERRCLAFSLKKETRLIIQKRVQFHSEDRKR